MKPVHIAFYFAFYFACFFTSLAVLTACSESDTGKSRHHRPFRLLSQLLTLYLTPLIYVCLDRLTPKGKDISVAPEAS